MLVWFTEPKIVQFKNENITSCTEFGRHSRRNSTVMLLDILFGFNETRSKLPEKVDSLFFVKRQLASKDYVLRIVTFVFLTFFAVTHA